MLMNHCPGVHSSKSATAKKRLSSSFLFPSFQVFTKSNNGTSPQLSHFPTRSPPPLSSNFLTPHTAPKKLTTPKPDARTGEEILGPTRSAARLAPHPPPAETQQSIANVADAETAALPHPDRRPRRHPRRRRLPRRDRRQAHPHPRGRQQGPQGRPRREGARLRRLSPRYLRRNLQETDGERRRVRISSRRCCRVLDGSLCRAVDREGGGGGGRGIACDTLGGELGKNLRCYGHNIDMLSIARGEE